MTFSGQVRVIPRQIGGWVRAAAIQGETLTQTNSHSSETAAHDTNLDDEAIVSILN